MQPKLFHFSPGRILFSSFVFVITAGAFLLALPQSRTVSIPFLDLLFTSASTTCITGLSVVPISSFTTLGKVILLCLIQLGGLGLMTLSFFFISLFLNMGMATQLMAGELLEFKWWSRIKSFLFLIIGITFVTELIGAALLYFSFRQNLPIDKAIFHAIFYSVSAFCNAGISLDTGTNILKTTPLVFSTLSFLIFAGGIGFLVWFELGKKIKTTFQTLRGKKTFFRFSLHTKIVIITSFILIIVGALGTWFLEAHNTLQEASAAKGFFVSLFNSISIRNAGFQIFNLEQVSLATLLLFMFLMYIGASPGSTGSGIKTTTLALFVATMVAFIRNREEVELFGRTVPQDQIYKAIAIVALSATWILGLTFLLLATETTFSFVQILFEAISAFSCCGLSIGITPYFSSFAKILLIITMIVGRIGSLTLILALRKKRKTHKYHYPEERVTIG